MSQKKDQTLFHFILIILGILIVGGVFILAAISTPYSIQKFGRPNYFLKNQFFKALLPGLIFIFIFAHLPPLDKFKKVIPVIFVINLILLGLVFVPSIGMRVGGSARWLSLGPLSFQPSEFMKLSFILYFAYLGAEFFKKKATGKILLAMVILLLPIGLLLYCQPDFSTLGIIAIIAFGMYIASGVSWGNLLLVFLAGSSIGGILIANASYRLKRLKLFFNPNYSPLNVGYHLRQLLLAVGSGRIFGQGLGFGSQKFGFLPHSINDSIFAIIAEETGFVGSSVLIILFVALAVACFMLARRKENIFHRLLIVGIASWLFVQFTIHVAANIGIFPLTGMPLPFISYGGSALLAELLAVGVLINVSTTNH